MTSRYARNLRALATGSAGLLGGCRCRDRLVKPWDKVFDPSLGVYGRWFAGAECNTCFNCVDRHAAKRPEAAAIIYDSPVTDRVKRISYRDLLDRRSGARRRHARPRGRKGDRVILYLPMIPEAAIAMLACARLGAIHSVVFGGFAAPELATRIDDARRS